MNKIIDINNKFRTLFNNKSQIENIELKSFFPDLNEKTLELLEQDSKAKKEIVQWLDNEILGVQFNAIRCCSVPEDPNLTRNEVEYSNVFCESFKMCPLYRNGAAPIGNPCPLEKIEALKITEELIEELEIDIHGDYTDKYLIGELIMCTIIENRAFRGLSCSNLGFTNISNGKMGKEYKRQKSFYLDIVSEMQRTKSLIRKSLIATREEKIKLKQTKTVNIETEKYQSIVSKMNEAEKALPLLEID
ncbi:MAG: hypothetical protein ACRCW9_03070 [Cetobacterium sp.]